RWYAKSAMGEGLGMNFGFDDSGINCHARMYSRKITLLTVSCLHWGSLNHTNIRVRNNHFSTSVEKGCIFFFEKFDEIPREHQIVVGFFFYGLLVDDGNMCARSIFSDLESVYLSRASHKVRANSTIIQERTSLQW